MEQKNNTNTVLNNFPMYIPAQVYRDYLARWELFKLIVDVPGVIIECGVSWGGGLLSWMHYCWLLEITNYTRTIYGFDVFDPQCNFPSLGQLDRDDIGQAEFPSDYEHLGESIKVWTDNHIPGRNKAFLVKGDAVETIPKWVRENQHAVVALLYLDFDVYEPTEAALRHLIHLMPQGSIVAFDNFCYERWGGETVAAKHFLGLKRYPLRRFSFHPSIAYAVVGGS